MFEHLLQSLARSLEERNIPYMVVGGQAVLLYGEPRLTRDIDVTLGAGPERLPEILELVRDLGWHTLTGQPENFVRNSLVLPCMDSASGIRVDFIFSFSPYEHQAVARSRKVAVGNGEVRFASVEDLIIHKMVAGRPRDLEDIRSILLKRPKLDLPYLHYWLGEFDRSLGSSHRQALERLLPKGTPTA